MTLAVCGLALVGRKWDAQSRWSTSDHHECKARFSNISLLSTAAHLFFHLAAEFVTCKDAVSQGGCQVLRQVEEAQLVSRRSTSAMVLTESSCI
jgi:hypothetical protein